MSLDYDLFQEVVAAIGVDTCLAIIKMFQEQSPILVDGACDSSTDMNGRAELLHALKGMARQLGLIRLSHACTDAETAILNREDGDAINAHLANLRASLTEAHNILQKEALRLTLL